MRYELDVETSKNRAWWGAAGLSVMFGTGGAILHAITINAPAAQVMVFGFGLAMVHFPVAALVAMANNARVIESTNRLKVKVIEHQMQLHQPAAQEEGDEWKEVIMPTGQRGWVQDQTTDRAKNAFYAENHTVAKWYIDATADDDDPEPDQIQTIDVSWCMWHIANNIHRVGNVPAVDGDFPGEEAWIKSRLFANINHLRTVRGYMLSKHLLRMKNPNYPRVGYKWGNSGVVTMRALAGMRAPLSPILVQLVTGFDASYVRTSTKVDRAGATQPVRVRK